MRRGEVGQTDEQRAAYQQVARFILSRDAKDAVDLLNAVSIKKRSAKSAFTKKATITCADGSTMELGGDQVFAKPVAWASDGILAYDKETERDGLPDSIFQPMTRDAVAYISGHDELVRIWQQEHAEWLKKKTEWEAGEAQKNYLALRPHFEAFEQSVGGKAGKRRERWHLYLKWLSENPQLAGWRGAPMVVNELDTAARARVAKAKPWKQRSVEAAEFWNANPELAALDRLHGYYEREFVRRRKTKKNPDGFDHRPTFTMPVPVLHPRWMLFNAPQTSPKGYDELKLPEAPGEFGSLKLRLLTGERNNEGWPEGWVNVRFRSDPRLAQFRTQTVTTLYKKGRQKGTEKTKKQFSFWDRQLKCARVAQISGAKLILEDIRLNHDGSLKSAIPFLVFACTIEDLPMTAGARAIQWSETGELTKTGKKRKSKKLPSGLVSCAVDLGIRNLGFLTVVRVADDPNDRIRVLRSRNQWLGEAETGGKHAGRWSQGPDLAHIGQHKREIKRLRRLRGKPVKGERSHIELQEHIDDMGKDRFKKAARAIVNFALNVDKVADSTTHEPFPRADVLILEKLAGFIPDAERERGINRALVNWNRGQLVTRIKEVARDAGLKVFEVHPAGTSQCCSKCGALGRRYSIVRDEQTKKPTIRFGWVEKLFACPSAACSGRNPLRPGQPFTCNSDHNASVNLHRRFVFDDLSVGSFFQWKNKTDTQREHDLRAIDETLRPALESLHGLLQSGVDSPF